MQIEPEMHQVPTDTSSSSQTLILSDDEAKLLLRFRLLNKQNKSKAESFINNLNETQNNN